MADGELRKDYLLDRYVILARSRAKRPHQFSKEDDKKKASKDFFAPGNEDMTPPETGRISQDDGWKMRWFPNKFAAVRPEGDPDLKTHNDFFTFSDNFGVHEVIVETPDLRKTLADLSEDDLKQLLEVYRDRIEELGSKKGIRYVMVFKNHKKQAGTSIAHSHTQVIAYNIVPADVREKAAAASKYDSCPYCRIIDTERKSDRRISDDGSAVSFCPYASRFPMEAWIFPKDHKKRLKDLGDDELKSMAAHLRNILVKLGRINAPYNFFIHYSPADEDLHMHIEVTPRLATWAGFELGSGTIINAMYPEDAAAFYRENI